MLINYLLQPPPRPDLIDKKVIDGHVIPNHVIFTSSAPLDQPFETEAFEDNLKVTATFFTQNDGKSSKSKKFLVSTSLDFNVNSAKLEHEFS